MIGNYLAALTIMGWLLSTLALPNPSITSATESIPAPPVHAHWTPAPHTPYSGTPTVTGALSASSIGNGVASKGIPPSATTYPSDGKLHNPEPAPYVPAGGIETNGSTPVYNVRSDYNYESLVSPYLPSRCR